MSNRYREAFIKETFLLSRINPEQWDRFIRAFENYVREISDMAVQSSVENMVISCGRAQQAIHLCSDFMAINKLYEVIKASEQGKGHV